MEVTEDRRTCAARLRMKSGLSAMRLQAAISRVFALPPMNWSAPCSALARRSTVNLEQPRARAMEHHLAHHQVVNMGPSRESTAKSRRPPTLVLEGAPGYGALSGRMSVSPRRSDEH